MTETKRVQDLQDWKKEDKANSKDWLKRSKESFRFYTAYRQWKQEDIIKLDEEKRPHLTIPLITSIINTVVGYQIDNEQQFKLYPRRGGSAAVAAIGTELLKHTMDNCHGMDHCLEAFLYGNIGGVGAIEIQESFEKDKINGELRVLSKSPFRVIFDQEATEYDFDERGRRIFEEVWLSKEEIQLGFHKSIKDIEQAVESPEFSEEKLYAEDYSTSSTGDKIKGLYRVTKAYWRKWEKQVYLVDLKKWSHYLLHGPRTIELAKNAIEVQNKQAESLGIPSTFKIIERAGWKLYKTWFCGEMELLHQEDPWNGITDFPIKPYYPYWADGYPFGLVDGNKDAQRYLNKMFSDELMIQKQASNQIWAVKDGSNTRAVEDLKENSGKHGYVLDKSKFGGEADRIPPNTPPFGHELIIERLERFMNQISGVDPTLRGMQIGRSKESGKALESRLYAGTVVSKIIYKNFNRTLSKVGEFLWDSIRKKDETGQNKYYSQQEIERIVQEASLKQFIKVGRSGEQVIDLTPFYEDIGNYGIKVSTSPNTQTIRAENQNYLLSIAEIYGRLYGTPIIPPKYLIEMSDLPNKDELIEYFDTLAKQPATQQPIQMRKGKTA